MDCGICASENVAKSRMAVCPACDYASCVDCLRQYFKELPEPACPSCSKVWTREFISLHLGGFYNDYKKMREKLLLEREKMLLPETQAAAELEKQARLIETELDYDSKEYSNLMKRADELREQIREKKTRVITLRTGNPAAVMVDGPITLRTGKPAAVAVAGPKVVCHCPVDGCRGFVMSDEHKCGLCETTICKKCEMVAKPQHECKPEDIETIKAKKRETKPCPKCHTIIYKIDGCDQMWCTQCRTAFSWDTGREVHTRIHNPHFYEWQRQANGGVAPRVPGDEVLGCGQVTSRQLYDLLGKRGGHFTYLENLHRLVGHVNDALIEPPETDNKQLRITYMLGDITEAYFARRVQQIDKKRQKDVELRQISEVLSTGANDIFRKIVAEARGRFISPESEARYIHEGKQLVEFVNEQFLVVATKYKVKPRKIVADDKHQMLLE